MQELKDLPVGVQNFSSIIEENYVYADKTHFISKLDKSGRAYFLTRPRRFGKSLFLSTLKAYFEGKQELFKGLAIERIKAETNSKWKKYPVLRFDLSGKNYTKADDLTLLLNAQLDGWKEVYKVECNYKDAELVFARMLSLIHEKTGERVVILIDEYDAPLLQSLEDEELHKQYRSILHGFYSVIKGMSEHIYLSFLTGITKFSKVSIFSSLNNLFDISYMSEYSHALWHHSRRTRKQFCSIYSRIGRCLWDFLHCDVSKIETKV